MNRTNVTEVVELLVRQVQDLSLAVTGLANELERLAVLNKKSLGKDAAGMLTAVDAARELANLEEYSSDNSNVGVDNPRGAVFGN